MPERARSARIPAIVLLIGAILCLHYFTRYDLRYYHAFFRLLFYVPLVLGSFWFGLKGALSVCASVTALYLPYVFQQWQGFSVDDFDTILEGVIFIAFSIMLGMLVETLQMESNERIDCRSWTKRQKCCR